MATFTVTLSEAIELDPAIETETLKTYPIFDEDYRERLNGLIVDRYLNQEIGQETISMFRLALRRRLNEIMPYWNEQYKLSLITVDPLSTVSIKSLTQSDETSAVEGTSKSDSASLAKSRAVSSDTPQTQLNPTQDYASAMQDNVSDSEATGASTENQNTTQSGTNENTMSGYQGHTPLLIAQTRQALVNIDIQVLDALQDLFMLIWSNHDSFTGTGHHFGGYRHYGIY